MTSSVVAPIAQRVRWGRAGNTQWMTARAAASPRQYAAPATALLLIVAGVVAHAWNLFNYPRYQGDEGVYMSAAWSVAHGQIYPYTYTYGHPPLAWILIAAWCQLTGGFFTFGTAINPGRVFMLVVGALTALFVYLIARRITGNDWVALLAMALSSFSPLAIFLQREVLLDNIAICWVLLAFCLQLYSKDRLTWIIASAFAFGAGFLSKETMIVLLPALIYNVWSHAMPYQRRYMVTVFTYVALAISSTFMLAALLKNEFFQSGTLLGGSNQHVSMLLTLMTQAGRGSAQGSFVEQWAAWINTDGLLMIGGLIGMFGNLALGWRIPTYRVVAFMPLIYLLFLLRGGVTLEHYVIPLIPLLALNIALFAYRLLSILGHVASPWNTWKVAPHVAPAIALVALCLSLGLNVQMNHTNFTANETTPQTEAIQWMGEHVPRSATVIASHYDWLDMRSSGGLGARYGAPFEHVEMYWVVATDPAISEGFFHNDWRNVDYIMMDSDMQTDASAFDMKLLNDAMQHATPVVKFQNKLYWVTIYQVQHDSPNTALLGSPYSATASAWR